MQIALLDLFDDQHLRCESSNTQGRGCSKMFVHGKLCVGTLLVNIMPTQRLPINVYSMKGFSISVYHREMCLHIELQCVPSVHLQSSHTNFLTLS